MRGIVVSVVMLTGVLTTTATAHHEARPPKAISKVKVVKRVYPKLYQQEVKSKKVSWEQLRDRARIRWYKQHKFNLESIYWYWKRTGDTYGTVQRTYQSKAVPGWKRGIYNCIFSRESGWRSDVWYGGATGWQPGYAGSNRVNGVAQLRPGWANGYLATEGRGTYYGSDSASWSTFHITSDPIASTIISLRIGTGPFFAQGGSCF